jgi:hypothetical protein
MPNRAGYTFFANANANRLNVCDRGLEASGPFLDGRAKYHIFSA